MFDYGNYSNYITMITVITLRYLQTTIKPKAPQGAFFSLAVCFSLAYNSKNGMNGDKNGS